MERERERERDEWRVEVCCGEWDKFSSPGAATTQSNKLGGMIFGMTARHMQSFIVLPRCSSSERVASQRYGRGFPANFHLYFNTTCYHHTRST